MSFTSVDQPRDGGAAGREFLAIPGPSVMPHEVLTAMASPMVDIYDGELVEVSDYIYATLPSIAGSSGELILTIGNGHAGWEMAIANTMSRGDKVLVANCGIFAAVWGELAAQNGVRVEQLDAHPGRAIDPADLAERLAVDVDGEIKAVLTVHADTASSARNDIAALRQAIDATGHGAMLFVDCIASLGCERFEMDRWGVDLVVGASQKGLMTPPGLAFNIVGPRALDARESANLVTYYWDWDRRRDRSAHYHRYCGTPPVSHLFGLQAALRMIEAEGLANRFERHERLARAVHAAVRTWADAAGCSFVVAEPMERCHSVTSVGTGAIDAAALRRWCHEHGEVLLGVGLRGFADRSFRIGHMGYVNPPMLLGVLGTIDLALAALGIPTDGVGAAIGELGRTTAGTTTGNTTGNTTGHTTGHTTGNTTGNASGTG